MLESLPPTPSCDYFRPTLIPGCIHVYIGIDYSGSMGSHAEIIRQALLKTLDNTQQRNPEDMYCFHFITFSNTVDDNADLRLLPFTGGSTNIFLAFERQINLIKANPKPKRIITAFISDGEDDGFPTINQRLKELLAKQVFDVPMTFITVAVGNGFPTTMTLLLREFLHKGTSNFLPHVIPIRTVGDISKSIEMLSNAVLRKDHFQTKLSDHSHMQLSELPEAAEEAHGYYTMKCSSLTDPGECIKILGEAKKIIEKIQKRANALLTEARLKVVEVDPNSDEAKRAEILASKRIAKAKLERNETLTILQNMLEKINELLAEAGKGVLIATMKDDAKQKALTYGHMGKYAAKASKYHAGRDIRLTVQSLVKYLKELTPDQLELMSFGEVFLSQVAANTMDIWTYGHMDI